MEMVGCRQNMQVGVHGDDPHASTGRVWAGQQSSTCKDRGCKGRGHPRHHLMRNASCCKRLQLTANS